MTEISKEYGTALFMLALESGKQREYGEILEEIGKIFSSNPSYLSLLSSPSIPISERLNLIDGVFSDKLPEEVLSYLKLLCEKNRIEGFYIAKEEYQALLKASERVFSAKVISAEKLTQAEKKKLISKLEKVKGGKVEAEYEVDKSLIGGVIVEIDGKIMDGSLRHRLQEVKEVIIR